MVLALKCGFFFPETIEKAVLKITSPLLRNFYPLKELTKSEVPVKAALQGSIVCTAGLLRPLFMKTALRTAFEIPGVFRNDAAVVVVVVGAGSNEKSSCANTHARNLLYQALSLSIFCSN